MSSLKAAYVACVRDAFARQADSGNRRLAAEQAFLECQTEENALYSTAIAPLAGFHPRRTLEVRAALDQLKVNLKQQMVAPAKR